MLTTASSSGLSVARTKSRSCLYASVGQTFLPSMLLATPCKAGQKMAKYEIKCRTMLTNAELLILLDILLGVSG